MPERYKEEIEEILKQVNETPTRGGLSHSDKNGSLKPRKRSWLFHWSWRWRVSPGKVLFTGVVLLLAALVLNALAPGYVPFAAWAGLFLLIVSYLLFFLKPGPAREKRWRGRPIDTSITWRERLRRWFGI